MSMNLRGAHKATGISSSEVLAVYPSGLMAGTNAQSPTSGPLPLIKAVMKKNVEDWFCAWADEWRRETAHLSSHSTRRRNAAYIKIVGLGQVAVPILLGELIHRPDFWFSALREITGDDPVHDGIRGKYDEMRNAWLDWANARGIEPRDVRQAVSKANAA